MRRTKKQILGFAGLAIVAIITAIAYALPTPNAAAEEGDEPTPASTSVDVQVRVLPDATQPALNLVSPSDGLVTSDSVIEVKASHSRVENITYTLSYYNEGSSTPVQVYSVDRPVSYEPGIDSFSLNLDDVVEASGKERFGKYELAVQATAVDGTVLPVDRVTFEFVAITAVLKDHTASNDDPILGVTLNESVDLLRIQLYNSRGEPMFVDAAGNEEPFMVPRSAMVFENGEALITLPFEKYGIKPGDYQAVISAYNDSGDMMGMTVVDIKYTTELVPDGDIDTPNTGSTLFRDLNISHVDYLITGLFVFGIVSGFGLYLIHRKSRR